MSICEAFDEAEGSNSIRPAARGEALDDEALRERWIAKGWIDLRESNLARWQTRFRKMLQAREVLRHTGSAAANIRTYSSDKFEIGEVVAWIFNNELGGYRIK